MDPIDAQTEYWNSKGVEKNFAHPINFDWLRELLPADAKILDYGCGYGRLTSMLKARGYREIVGVDASQQMIARAKRENPGCEFLIIDQPKIPFLNESFDLVLLFTVLTCTPTDLGQRAIIREVRRVLRSAGLLYVSDFLLQPDDRNTQRYRRDADKFGMYGVFELPEGAIMRHHTPQWIAELMSEFHQVTVSEIAVTTMNGNSSVAFQALFRRD